MKHFRTFALAAPSALLLALAMGCAEEPEQPAPTTAGETAEARPAQPAPLEEAPAPEPEAAAPQPQPQAKQPATAAPGLATQMPQHSEEFLEKVEQFQTTLTDQAEAAYRAELEACEQQSGQAAEDCRRGALLRYQTQQETIAVRVQGLMSRDPERTKPRR